MRRNVPILTVVNNPLTCKVRTRSVLISSLTDTWRRVSKIGADSAT